MGWLRRRSNTAPAARGRGSNQHQDKPPETATQKPPAATQMTAAVAASRVNPMELPPTSHKRDRRYQDLRRMQLNDLSPRNWTDTDFKRADLRSANLSGIDLSQSSFYYAEMPNANLSGANLSNTDLTGASMYGVDLRGANLEGATLPVGSLLSDARIDEHTNIDVPEQYDVMDDGTLRYNSADAIARDQARRETEPPDFSFKDLSGQDLTGRNMVKNKLTYTNLTGANLTNADLQDANLMGTNLTDANLDGANLDNAIVQDSTTIDLPDGWKFTDVGYGLHRIQRT